jgi:hypothetical protein
LNGVLMYRAAIFSRGGVSITCPQTSPFRSSALSNDDVFRSDCVLFKIGRDIGFEFIREKIDVFYLRVGSI